MAPASRVHRRGPSGPWLLGVGLGAVTLATAVGSVLWAPRTGVPVAWATLPFVVSAGLLGAFLVASRPRNLVGWCLSLSGVLFGTGLLAEHYAAQAPLGEVPGPAWAAWTQRWVYLLAALLTFVVVPMTYPEGRPPAGAWRRASAVVAATGAGAVVLAAVAPTDVVVGGRTMPNPVALHALAPAGDLLATVPWLVAVVLVLVATGGFLRRVRRSTGDGREQLTWLSFAYGLVALALVADAAVAAALPAVYPVVFVVVQLLPAVAVGAMFVGIVRHRVLDVDLLVRRTIVYAGVTAVLVGVYVVAVGLLAAALGARDGAAPVLATAVVAAVLAPVREGLQRAADRLLHGERHDPLRALTLLGGRLAQVPAPQDLLPAVARAVVDAVRVPYAAVEVDDDGEPVVVGEAGRRPRDGEDVGEPWQTPLVHAGVTVGRLTVCPRGPGQPLAAADRRVLAQLARQVGPTAHGVLLAERLRRSRDAVVAAREEERRRVGRDLHDGVGPQVAAAAMRLEAARDVVVRDPGAALPMMDAALDTLHQAIEDVRSVAHSLRPPLLGTLGLRGALEAQAGAVDGFRVVVDASGLPPLPAAVEHAAYLVALEAVRNARRHSGGSRCDVRLRVTTAGLVLDVRDDGRGRDPLDPAGLGLASMTERAHEVGGDVEVLPGRPGTVVRAVLPLAGADDASSADGVAAAGTVRVPAVPAGGRRG